MVALLTATFFQGFMATGKTSPALCGCVDKSGEDCGEYVVKLRGAVEGGDSGLVNELLATRLAGWFGLATPEPGIVVIERALAELIMGQHPERKSTLESSVGPISVQSTS